MYTVSGARKLTATASASSLAAAKATGPNATALVRGWVYHAFMLLCLALVSETRLFQILVASCPHTSPPPPAFAALLN